MLRNILCTGGIIFGAVSFVLGTTPPYNTAADIATDGLLIACGLYLIVECIRLMLKIPTTE